MKKTPAKMPPPRTFPATSIRIDPDLRYRAKQLALSNQRDNLVEDAFSKVVNAALGEYLKKRGA